jgi:HEPN domain-containing protein
MSRSKLHHEAERWLQTAGEDLRAAQTLRADGLYAHACFIAQQCGEKAVKAMWYAVGQEPWGHSIQKLVMQFPEPQHIPDLDGWTQRAAQLDKFYIPTRYPNGLPDLTPGQSYFLRDADQAIQSASMFLKASRQFLASRDVG